MWNIVKQAENFKLHEYLKLYVCVSKISELLYIYENWVHVL